MNEPYLIKKYSSRRLYDVAAGRFVTLGEVDRLVRDGHHIKVVDADGGDITQSVLLQILAEHEATGGQPLLSVELLHQIVRLYGNAMQGMFTRYLEDGMALLRKQQETWQNLPGVMQAGTGDVLKQMMDQQMSMWLDAQKAFFSPSAPRAPQGADAPSQQDRRGGESGT